MRYWLMKTEPSAFSIVDLERAPNGCEPWEGIRNYQARNFMRDEMKQGDRVLIYHSSTEAPAVVGTARVAREAYPDPTAFDPESRYFDPKSTPEAPRWMMVDVQFESRFAAPITLAELRSVPALQGMRLLQRGQRLSIMPVAREEFDTIFALAARQGKG